MSEITILAGTDRSLDFAHLNPLGVELEIEQNRRENIVGNQTNAVWIADVDWLAKPGLRLTGSYLIDEIKLDKGNGRAFNQIGYSARVAWTPYLEPINCTLYGKVVHIGSYTLRHNYAYCNFVNRGTSLSDTIGNDAEKYTFGVRVIPFQKMIFTAEYWNARRGSNSLQSDPYKVNPSPQRREFPSGTISQEEVLMLHLNYFPIRFIQIEGSRAQVIHSNAGIGKNAGRWSLMLRFIYS